jgi:gluconate kinase
MTKEGRLESGITCANLVALSPRSLREGNETVVERFLFLSSELSSAWRRALGRTGHALSAAAPAPQTLFQLEGTELYAA